MADPALLEGIGAGDTRAIARALSLVENDAPEGTALVDALCSAPESLVVGITGPPGAGKSTLVSQLVAAYRSGGRRVGVLAVDPTSASSGGAVLGDRIRMQAHALDSHVFIRSMATRGNTGGLARGTAGATAILSAAGFEIVLIETVGVGQDEIDIVRIADVVVVVLVPGTGDEVQALKAGLMEIADVFVVNKGDLAGADRAVATLESFLGSGGSEAAALPPPVIRVVATAGDGVAALVAAIDHARAANAGRIESRRREQRVARARSQRAGRSPATGEAAAVIDHVGIAVADRDAERFLREALGLTIQPAEVVPSQHVAVRFVDAGEARLELVEPTADDSPVARFVAQRGPGLHHIALRVKALQRTLDTLAARGIRLVDRVPRTGAHGRRVAFVHPASTGGVLVELIQDEGADA